MRVAPGCPFLVQQMKLWRRKWCSEGSTCYYLSFMVTFLKGTSKVKEGENKRDFASREYTGFCSIQGHDKGHQQREREAHSGHCLEIFLNDGRVRGVTKSRVAALMKGKGLDGANIAGTVCMSEVLWIRVDSIELSAGYTIEGLWQ